METKLLPCPFCDAEEDAIAIHEVSNKCTDYETGYWVECYDCGCSLGLMAYPDGTWDGYYKTKGEVAAAWNRRASDADK